MWAGFVLKRVRIISTKKFPVNKEIFSFVAFFVLKSWYIISTSYFKSIMNTAIYRSKRMALMALFLIANLVGAAPQTAADPPAPRFTAEQVLEDLDFIKQTIAENHPGLRFSADPRAVDETFRVLRAGIRNGMTQDDSWRLLARLNPVLADGHLLVGYSDWRGSTKAELNAGGTLFPYEVELSDGQLVIQARLGGAGTPLRGARIVAINGEAADAVAAPLLARMHGDTPSFRSALLAQRWWFYYRKVFGTPPSYRLKLARGNESWTVETPGSREIPALLRTEAEFDRQFHLDFEADGSAVLTIGSFALEDFDRFLTFTHDAFARLHEAGTARLRIDISANGGGDDPAWIKGLMPYLATAPYRIGSTYTKRVTVENADPSAHVGQVVEGTITTWHQPSPDNPLLFKGKTEVFIGPGTYSSAVLFANVMTDFGFAQLTGNGGAARRSQSGGVRRFTLPNSKLALWIPRFVLDPPMPAARGVLLEARRPSGNAGHEVHGAGAAH
jgi:hypothetical protein